MTLKRFSFKLICIYYLGKSRWTSENNFKSWEKIVLNWYGHLVFTFWSKKKKKYILLNIKLYLDFDWNGTYIISTGIVNKIESRNEISGKYMGFVCLDRIKVKAYEFNNTKIYGKRKRCEKLHNKVEISRGTKKRRTKKNERAQKIIMWQFANNIS